VTGEVDSFERDRTPQNVQVLQLVETNRPQLALRRLRPERPPIGAGRRLCATTTHGRTRRRPTSCAPSRLNPVSGTLVDPPLGLDFDWAGMIQPETVPASGCPRRALVTG
jgi:hypothetical protein